MSSTEPGTTAKNANSATTTTTTTTTTSDGSSMDYLTYEQKLAIVQENPKSEPLKDVLFFPQDNIRVVHQKKDLPKGLELVPTDGTIADDDVHMREIVRYFTSDIVKLDHPYNRFDKIKTEEGSKTFAMQKFEIDPESKKKREADNVDAKVDVNLEGLKSSSSTTQRYINKKITERLFKIYDMSTSSTEFDWQGGAEASICKRVAQERKFELKSTDPILIEVVNFEPRLFQKYGQLEPIFLEMALFDLKNKKKISETFHVDVNTSETMSLLPASSIPASDAAMSKLRSAVLHCSERTKDIFLYIKVLKVLQGDEDDSADPYLKGDRARESDVKKLKKAAADCSVRLHEFRQPIGWTAVAMFDDNEEIVLPTAPITQFFRTKGNMSDSSFMSIFGSDTTSQMRKIKPLPMSLQLKFTELTDYEPEYKQNSVVLVNNQEDSEGKGTLARDMKEFPVNPIQEFNNRLENWMFIYPEAVNFSKGLSSKSARNIAIKVQIKDNDASLDSDGLPLICGRSNEPALRTFIFTKVSYHNRTPNFNDEIKIKLPTKLTPNHHILFTFYHVRCANKANKPVQTVLGYSIVPLIQDAKNGRIIHGRKGCSVIAEFVAKEGYTSSEVRRSSKYVDYGKQLFEVVFEPLSTIHTNDAKLASFYKTAPSIFKMTSKNAASVSSGNSGVGDGLSFDTDAVISKDIVGLQEAPSALIIQHLPVVLNQILRTVCCDFYKQSQHTAFKTLLVLLDNVSMEARDKNSESGRNFLLQQYITEIFNRLPDLEAPLHQHLLNEWYITLDEYNQRRKTMQTSKTQYHHQQESQETRLPLVYSWWLFDLTYKSITIELAHRNLLDKEDRLNPERFNEEFYQTLQKLVELMGDEILYRSGVGLNLAKLLNSNLALFLRDLFNVMDRGFVMYLMDTYLKIINADRKNFEVLQELKITFLTVVTDFEHYVPMSLPMDYTVDRLLDEDRLAKDHFLAGILMNHIKDDILNPERTVRMRALTLVRSLLTKHEYDSRYQNGLYREKIAGIYFPFAVYFLDKFFEYRSIAEEKEIKLKKADQDAEDEVREIESRIKQTQMDEQSSDAAVASPSSESADDDDDDSPHTKPEETMEMKKLNEELEQARKRAAEAKKQFVEEGRRVKSEFQSILICVVFIVKSMNRSLLKQWWSKEMQYAKRLQSFLQMFAICLEVFEYEGKSAITERAKYGIETSTTASLSEAKVALENMYTSLDRRTTNFRSAASSLKSGRVAGRKGTLTRNFRVTRQTFKKTDSTTEVGSSDIGGQSKEIIKQMVLWDGNLSSEMSLSILDILLDMIVHLEKEFFASALSPLKSSARGFELLFKLLTKFMETSQSEKTMDSMLSVLKHFIILYRPIIFSRNTPYSETLCRQLLVKCHSRFEKIRSQATAILYTLIKNNYLHMGNFTRTKIQTTVALSNLVANLDDKSIILLRASFIAMAEYASNDTVERKNPLPLDGSSGRYSRTNSLRGSLKSPFDRLSRDETKDFPTQVHSLVTRLEKALLDTKKIKDMEKTSHDHELMSDLYWAIAEQYRHAPELSVTWVNNLADFHKKYDRWIEAAQCIAFIIAEVLEYLKLSGIVRESLSTRFLHKLSPLLRSERFEELHSLFEESGREQPVFESHYFTENGFLDLISQCIEYCNNDSFFEYSIELYKMRIEYFEEKEDYAALEEQHTLLATSYGTISKANVRQARLFGSYYKVAFYGRKHSEEIRNKVFIYKMPRITRLAEIVEYMETVFYNKYGKENVKFVSDSFEATDAIQQEDCAYIQITSVKAHIRDLSKRRTQFAQSTDIDEFMFETPFTKSGKSHGELVDQYKRKTVVKTGGIFPNVKIRFEVMSQEETVLSPIENAIEIIDGSLARLEMELKRDPPNANNLQMVLSGTVIPQVNEGIPAIVKSFLGCPNASSKFDAKHLETLREKLRTFLSLNAQGIQLSNKYASAEQQPLQRQFEKGFVMLEELFKPYLEY